MRIGILTAAVLHLDERNAMSWMDLGVGCRYMVYLALIIRSSFVKHVQLKI